MVEASADLMAFKRVTMLRIMWVFCSEMKMLQVLAEGLQGRDEIRRKKYSKKRDICELRVRIFCLVTVVAAGHIQGVL